jgi:aminoglycoside phosphotransferase family enzyme/predicted kinase
VTLGFSAVASQLRPWPTRGTPVQSVEIEVNKSPDWGSQRDLVLAMMEAGFYPKPPADVTHIETHISHVFLADDLVYKIKKAVRYSFLDYSTVARRCHFLNQELILNRRLAPSVYLAVIPITHDESGWHLGGEGEAVEYTLLMRRLPEKRMLAFLLESGQIEPEMIRAVAEMLASFHAQAERVLPTSVLRYPKAVERQWAENLGEVQGFVGSAIESDTFAAVKDFGENFFKASEDLLMRRAAQGWIRDVHGDLHCEHICFAPEGIQIYDCIEFNPRLRCCDLASEIAFLLMDLDVRGGGEFVEPFLSRYQELLDDPELPRLLPFYQCYRALVRGKVEALRAPTAPSKAAAYFRFAGRQTWAPFKPFLIMFSGLTGSGKSTLARELGERLGMPVISSDAVRKAIAGKLGRVAVPFNEGIYSVAMTERTYARMGREAENQVARGKGAILDATFIQKVNREKMFRLATKLRVPLFVIDCVASDGTTKERLMQRAAEGRDLSNGRWEIYTQQKKMQQPVRDIVSDNTCLELNTEAPVSQLIQACERFLRSRLLHPGTQN